MIYTDCLHLVKMIDFDKKIIPLIHMSVGIGACKFGEQQMIGCLCEMVEIQIV